MKFRFDRDLINDQMNALGLSERSIIRETGIPNFTFRQARRTGEFEGTLTLKQLHALADTLGVTLAHLLTTPTDQPLSTDDRCARDDAAEVIPLLVDVPKMVAPPLVAQSLGWSRERLEAALAVIPALLDGTGLRLHRSSNGVKVVPVSRTNFHARQALGRVRALGLGLNTSQAAVLARIIDGDNILDRMPSNTTRVAVGLLKNTGCITLNDEAVYEPTDALRLALPDL